jgi:hypothetical protein
MTHLEPARGAAPSVAIGEALTPAQQLTLEELLVRALVEINPTIRGTAGRPMTRISIGGAI